MYTVPARVHFFPCGDKTTQSHILYISVYFLCHWLPKLLINAARVQGIPTFSFLSFLMTLNLTHAYIFMHVQFSSSVKVAQREGIVYQFLQNRSVGHDAVAFCRFFFDQAKNPQGIPSVWRCSCKPTLPKGSPRVWVCACGFFCLFVPHLVLLLLLIRFSFFLFQHFPPKDRYVQFLNISFSLLV